MKKEITIDFTLYSEELDKQYIEGYESAFCKLSKFLIITDTQNADIYLKALNDFCVQNEYLDLIDKVEKWYKGVKK